MFHRKTAHLPDCEDVAINYPRTSTPMSIGGHAWRDLGLRGREWRKRRAGNGRAEARRGE